MEMDSSDQSLIHQQDKADGSSKSKLVSIFPVDDDVSSEIDQELNASEFKLGFEFGRWAMLAIFCGVMFMNQISFNTLWFKDSSQMQYMPGIFFLVLFTTTTSWIDKQGLYRNLLIAITIQMFALLFAIKGGSYGNIAGSILVGIAMPFIFNSLITFSATWFGVRGRILATGILLFSMVLGESSALWAFKYNISKGLVYYDDAFLGIGLCNLGLVFVVAFLFRAKPGSLTPTKSQTIYKRVDFDYMRDLEIFKEDIHFKKGFMNLCILLIFTYLAPYCLNWHYQKIIIARQSKEIIFTWIYPLVKMGGIAASTLLLAKFLSFKK